MRREAVRLRHPPGRAGRLWLDHRLGVARSGADLLDKKSRALAMEERRLRVLARQTASEWGRAAQEAEAWLNRAAVMAGEAKLALVAAWQSPASVEVRFRSSMGVAFPAEARVTLGPAAAGAAGGSAATDLAVAAYRRAVEAAAADAAARTALRLVAAERALAGRRRRAVERRWIPALSEAARRLQLALDELEREEATRIRWARDRRPEAT